MKKDIIIYYLFSFLLGFYIANGTTVLFERVLGFSYQQIFMIGGAYMLMFILFEVPSGAFADLLGRKKSIALGCFIIALGALATGISTTFWQVFASFFLWALGFSFISGADQALLYDRISDHKIYTRVLGHSKFFFLGATALAGILGPYLFSLNFRYPYLFSALPFLGGSLAILFFQEAREKHEFTLKKHWEQIKEGVSFTKNNKYILWSMGLLALTFAVWYNLFNSYQPFLIDVGFTIRAFSLILPAIFLCEALGGMIAAKLLDTLGESRVFVFGLLMFGLSVGAAGLLNNQLSLAFLLLYCLLLGVLRTVLSGYANHHIESSHRATVISVQSMVATVAAALSLFLFGFLTDRLGISQLFVILGVITLVCSVALLLVRPRESGTP